LKPYPLRMFLRAALVLCTLLLSACETTLFAGLNVTDHRAGIDVTRNLVFDAQHRLDLDVYRPANAEHAPVVVFFYGGSWTRGERGWYRFVGTTLAAHGVVVVIPDYRKYPQVMLDGFMQDAARAVAWTYEHAHDVGGAPNSIFVMGHSAGGQIGALLATDPSWLAPYHLHPADLAGFIGLAGCYAFTAADRQDKDMHAVFGHDETSWARAQPINFVSGHEPPMLLLQGTADSEVDPSNATALAHALEAHHDTVTLKLYPGAGHHALIFALSRPMQHDAPTLSDTLQFIHAHSAATAP
jgi:acetyl esterase/lipase